MSFRAITVQKAVTAPALKTGGQFPGQVAGIFKARIHAKGTIGRVRMGRVTGDEHPAFAIVVSKAEPQFPEADIVELDIDWSTDSLSSSCCERKTSSAISLSCGSVVWVLSLIHI